jgi:fengycin family lipopeptide synthetase D
MAKVDLRFGVTDGVNKIYLGIDYKANLFEAETITNLLQNFSKIIDTVVDNMDVRLSEIKLESNLQQLEMVSIEDIDFGF